MQTPGFETIAILLVVVGAVCAFAGYAFAEARARRAGGGKTAEQLKAELVSYKENVTEHFQTTANLLHDMTEQYRSVYEHMAAGAQRLCDTEHATAQIESLQAGLLQGRDTPGAVPGSERPLAAESHTGVPGAGGDEPGQDEGPNLAGEANVHASGVPAVGVEAGPESVNAAKGA